MLGVVLVVIATVFIPPLGVFLVAGCGADLLINVALTLLGYFPGHIHAFYLEYVYYHRKDMIERTGFVDQQPAPGIYSERVQTGGKGRAVLAAQAPAQAGYGTMPPGRV